ncbi:MAG: sulfatase-like hydrolase/transferase [Thermoplasmata archaeon]|nr:sulfatase-like hydrolase/transferase [Thermoplasmata archaeon]
MPNCNVILIILDTLREDSAGPIGELLKGEGFREYRDVIAPSPWTIPSHASMFTGKYPLVHGAHETPDRKAYNIRIRDRSGFLSKRMREEGYANYLLSANPYITADFGYDDFDDILELLYQPRFEVLNDAEKREMYRLRKKKDTTGKIISTLIGRGDIKLLFKGALNRVVESSFVTAIYHQYQHRIQKWPFEKGAKKMVEYLRSKVLSGENAGGRFVVINMMEAHEPYFRKPILNMKLNLNQDHYKKTVNRNFLDNLWNAYRKEIGYIKEALREIIYLLNETGELDRSLIVVTSDHGQLLGEHDQLGHGTFLYDELIRVPLFIRYPSDMTLKEAKQKGRYISLTSLYDLISKGEERYNEEHLFSEAAFSETYGISNIFKPTMDCEREKIKRLERRKIAIFHNGFKGIFDTEDLTLEEASSHRGGKVTRNVREDLATRALEFMETEEKKGVGRVRFSKKI